MSVITVGAFEAKTKLSELLRRVEQGDEVIITRHGKPVARLLPHHQKRYSPKEAEAALERLRELRKGVRLRGIGWRELRAAARSDVKVLPA